MHTLFSVMALICLLILVALMSSLARSGHVNDGIVNGTKVRPHSRPYMVSVGQFAGSSWKHRCGGFLVSDQFVMTAAHCWKYGDNLTVALGAHDLYDSKNKFTPMAVKYYHIYPPYHHAKNDIMLLQLKSKVQMNSTIGYINLTTTTHDIKANSICSTAGWGRKQQNGITSKRLMEVDVTVMDQQVCAASWGKRFSRSGMMCTGGHGGFCEGDSGGPLVCNNTAVGIVSFNYKICEQPFKPNVYTKISHYLPWINAIIHVF